MTIFDMDAYVLTCPTRLLGIATVMLLFSSGYPAMSETTYPELQSIAVTLVDGSNTEKNLGTFQSHNQKVVANANGIFMTYLRDNNETDDNDPDVWRLVYSKDGGDTFSTIYEGRGNTRSPVIETDEENNIYLAHPEYGSPAGQKQDFLVYRFSASSNYRRPSIQTFGDVACAAKYAMAYDASRKQFYIATQYGMLVTVDMDGNAGAHIIGSFTARADPEEPWKVYFFRIPAAKNSGKP